MNRKAREKRKDKTFLHPFVPCFGVAQHKSAPLRFVFLVNSVMQKINFRYTLFIFIVVTVFLSACAPVSATVSAERGNDVPSPVGELGNVQPQAEPTTGVYLPAILKPPPSGERGRVQIVNNNVVADNGFPLRGEHVVFNTDTDSNAWTMAAMYDVNVWRMLRDDYRLNTIRLMMSRPPQNWGGGPGDNCEPPIYRCYPLDYVHPNGKTTLQVMDDMVNMAAALGMYIIIDYHPVLGHYEVSVDAAGWWSQVAPRYADRTHVIYEASNEPGGSSLTRYEEELYALIRSYAPDTHIILWSFDTLNSGRKGQVDKADSIDYSNASVGYHPYWSYNTADLETLRSAYPVINTEIGADRVKRTGQEEANNVSWIWLDGAAGLYSGTPPADTFQPEDVTWPADPDAVDR